MSRYFIESCCTSVERAVAAEAAGANRVELCVDLDTGGLTPHDSMIREAVSRLDIPVNVLVRPRPGDFVYTEAEAGKMVETISLCRSIGANGVVIGALREDGSVDMALMKRLIEAAGPLSVTFHRAFDRCSDPEASLEDVITLGCNRLLTSGCAPDAFEGRFEIARLKAQAAGRILILAGCGITPENIDLIAADSSADEFHGSRIP